MGETYILYFFMVLMLMMGTLNMLMLKFQHMQMAPMSPGGEPQHFDHPWLQAALMMVGELLCLPIYFFTRSVENARAAEETPKWVFLVPCCCDLIATALLCMGLGLIAVSVAQMCRGTVIIFVCVMSYIFLRRRQRPHQVTGVCLVLFGIVLVSMAALQGTAIGKGASAMLAGIALCIVAQVFQASMFVYEEKIMSQYTVMPLQVVGMEGLFGVFISSALLVCLHIFGFANTPGALHQMKSSPVLALSVVGSMLAVALFNFAGATVTQKSSAVARTTIKISSTITIWLAELFFGWNTFSPLQFAGFVFVALGTIIYNRLVVINWLDTCDEMTALCAKKGLQDEEGKA
jgi:drug/metabolite transporter (DMT)-like permease